MLDQTQSHQGPPQEGTTDAHDPQDQTPTNERQTDIHAQLVTLIGAGQPETVNAVHAWLAAHDADLVRATVKTYAQILAESQHDVMVQALIDAEMRGYTRQLNERLAAAIPPPTVQYPDRLAYTEGATALAAEPDQAADEVPC
jgi:hypothetical protein